MLQIPRSYCIIRRSCFFPTRSETRALRARLKNYGMAENKLRKIVIFANSLAETYRYTVGEN